MNTEAVKRLSKVAKELNVATTTIVEYLGEKGVKIDSKPTTKISGEVYTVLLEKFQPDKLAKEQSREVVLPDFNQSTADKKTDTDKNKSTPVKEEVLAKPEISKKEEVKEDKAETNQQIEKPEDTKEEVKEETKEKGFKILGKIDLDDTKSKKKEKEKTVEKEKAPEPEKTEVTDKEKEKPAKPEKTEEKEASDTEEIKSEEEKTEETDDKKIKKEVEIAEDKAEPVDEPLKEAEEKITEAEPEPEAKGLKIVGKINLADFDRSKRKKQPVASTSDPDSIKKKRRKRKSLGPVKDLSGAVTDKDKKDKKAPVKKIKIDEKQIDEQIKETLSRLTGKPTKSKTKALKKKKRDIQRQRDDEQEQEELNIIKVTEFITTNDLASLMDVSVADVITTCLGLGLMVSINQRLDAETIQIVADEFGYDVDFKDIELDEPALEEANNTERLTERAPIVTIMGHVDHGKTSLLDYLRKSNIIAGEAGGITQHMGAYEVILDNGSKISFLDTPGHEAFTAMRARGAKVTDIAIIVIAADDSVMPQTKEAISHAQAAGVPIVFAFNKIDKETANVEKLKEQLSEMNILVEDWGGKYQSQEISAKFGTNVEHLLEKVLLEAELLELKADPGKRAIGTVIEATLDRGKGIVTTLLIQNGTLKVGDPVLAGSHFGKIKALFNERGQRIKVAGPSSPAQVLGFDGAPQAGDKFYVTETEHLGKSTANKRQQLIREQGMRTKKHITLDEIGRRLAIGSFKELNVIIKGDVDGSVEALSDSVQKLSTAEIQVNVIHKGVGQISESDVLLASASDAIIIGFQVRPSIKARKLAEQEQIEIRLYSVIYDAIEELKLAMEGMLAPGIEEKITGNAEIRDVFKVTKVGTVAGCMVVDGKIKRNAKSRLIRNGVVTYEGEITNLKRFKEDVKEVASGYECGISIKNYNDFKVGDIIEVYEELEVKRTL